MIREDMIRRILSRRFSIVFKVEPVPVEQERNLVHENIRAGAKHLFPILMREPETNHLTLPFDESRQNSVGPWFHQKIS
jgi:hypothetical protein